MTQRTSKALIVTRAQLARLLDCVPDRVTKYIAEGMPVAETGGGRGRETRIDLRTALPWLWERRPATATDAAKQRYYEAQAARAEFDLLVNSGKVLDADAAWSFVETMLVLTRTRLLAVPSKVKGKHQELTLQHVATMDDEICAALEAIADMTPEDFDRMKATVRTLRTVRKTA